MLEKEIEGLFSWDLLFQSRLYALAYETIKKVVRCFLFLFL